MSALRKGTIEYFPREAAPKLTLAWSAPPSEPPPPPPEGPQFSSHPGYIIRKRLLNDGADETWLISYVKTHTHLKEPERTIKNLLAEKGRITVDVAVAFSSTFNLSEMFFMNLQNRHDEDLKRQNTPPTLIS